MERDNDTDGKEKRMKGMKIQKQRTFGKRCLWAVAGMMGGAAIVAFSSCREDKLDLYDTTASALNIAKGTVFGSADDYPEEYAFNAYFLGSQQTDHQLDIPVRLQGAIDADHDRTYRVAIVDSATVGAVEGQHFSVAHEQTFRHGLYQDTLRVTIHLDRLSETDDYRLRLALVPGGDFEEGVPLYQYVDISFTKNLTIAPAFWDNNSKLRRIAYSPRKCAVFLQVSGITDPNWVDDGSSVIIDYWISLCQQWFEQHEEYDADGNRIYFE